MALRTSSRRLPPFLLLLLLWLLGCCSTQVSGKNLLPVSIEPDHQVAVRVGQNQTILCRVEVPVQFCRFQIPGVGGLVLTPDDSNGENIEYYGAGFDKGECGIRIASVKAEYDGDVTCHVTPVKGRTENTETVRLVVAKSPAQPELLTYRHNIIYDGPYRSGEKMEINCAAKEGRPPANVSLYLDDVLIESNQRSVAYGRQSDENKSVAKTTLSVTPNDNGKLIQCKASHIALRQPLETTKRIEVYFPPQSQPPIERFGYSIGRPGEVNVTVHANPMPDFVWSVDNVKISAGRTDPTGRLQTNSAVDLGNGYWSVVLNIDSVQKSDTEKAYSLEAKNSEGRQSYRINLSSSLEPPAGVDLDAGSIIGIVIGILALIVAVFLIVFARATGRWCFAARRSRSDEEAAGGAGAGSEAHITPASDEDDEPDRRIISEEKLPPMQDHGRENPVHTSSEYVNGRGDLKGRLDGKKTESPV